MARRGRRIVDVDMVAELYRRITDLEEELKSRPKFAPVGIQFNKDNEGGWLYVVVRDHTEIGYGDLGLVMADPSGFGMLFDSDGSFISLLPGQIALNLASGNARFALNSGGIVMKVGNTKKLTVTDHLDASIFEVRDDGTVHIKTGGTVIADL